MALPKPSVPEAFRKAIELLESERVPFVVIGGLAASLQGEPRNTEDADYGWGPPGTRPRSTS